MKQLPNWHTTHWEDIISDDTRKCSTSLKILLHVVLIILNT